MDHPLYTSFHLRPRHAYTRLYVRISRTSMQFVVIVRWAAIINTVQPFVAAEIQRHRSKQRLLPKCKHYNAYKKFHIFNSLIYPLPIFTCRIPSQDTAIVYRAVWRE